VFDQPDTESVAAQYDRIIDALSDKLPKVADHLEAARPDLLAFVAVGMRCPSGRASRHHPAVMGQCGLGRTLRK